MRRRRSAPKAAKVLFRRPFFRVGQGCADYRNHPAFTVLMEKFVGTCSDISFAIAFRGCG
jgi:hypothetical protein